ncbi:hypothetical protein IT408_03570 [Candidatus Uhrbacteria bacterium]|nr:hypothetical protein [Candidatus Uhrbacteria bacterium]
MQITSLPDAFKPFCIDEHGVLKPKEECRASLINHLILDDGMGVDEAEDFADKSLRDSGLWPVPDFTWDTEEDQEEKNIK